MSCIIDGSAGITTPGVVNTAGETIATTLSVTGVTTLTGGLNAALPVLSGGTGVTTSTGTGAVVLGTSPTLVTPALGAATATSLTVSGDVLITSANVLGYSTGSGGTVTQATSKGTAFTLNKPTGAITMNNASLAANTSINFQMNNSFVAAIDTIVFSPQAATIDMTGYQWGAGTNGAGIVVGYLRNITAGARAEAVVFNFAIIKGATS
jgi:hypothetical protein